MSATLERGPAVTAAYAGRRRLPVAVPVAIALAWAAADATGVAGRFHHDALLGRGTPSLAGAFQFSSLKDRCLTECRHPAAYLLRHYRRGPRAAFRLGWGHGLYCLGCCWALMLPPPPPAWPPSPWPRWSPCTRRGCRRSWPAWPASSGLSRRGRRPHLSPCQQLDL
jgi:hypothetical protein